MRSKFVVTKYELDEGFIVPIKIPSEFITAINPEAKGNFALEEPIYWRHLSRKHGWHARGLYISFDTFDPISQEELKSQRQYFYPILTPTAVSISEHKPWNFKLHWQQREWRGTTYRPEKFVGTYKSREKMNRELSRHKARDS